MISLLVCCAGSSLDDWRAALERYRGDLLEALDAEWLLAPRAELRERYLATLERVCTALKEAGHLANALSVAHHWALTAADRVAVTWTIDAGEAGAELRRREGKVALCRHRLRRLIA